MNWIGSKSAIYEIGKLSKATKNKRRVSEVNQFALVSQNETETLQNALWPILIHEISPEYFFVNIWFTRILLELITFYSNILFLTWLFMKLLMVYFEIRSCWSFEFYDQEISDWNCDVFNSPIKQPKFLKVRQTPQFPSENPWPLPIKVIFRRICTTSSNVQWKVKIS